MQLDASGKYPYSGSLDFFEKKFKVGGSFKFYAGFHIYCIWNTTHVMMTWILLYSFIFFILKCYAQTHPTSLNLISSSTHDYHPNAGGDWVFLNLFLLYELAFCSISIFLEGVFFSVSKLWETFNEFMEREGRAC